MKQKAFISIFILFISISVFSQETKFGVFVDPQISWFSPESRDVSSDGIVLGINGGLSLEKYFQKNYAFVTGLSIGTLGGKMLFDSAQTLTVYEEDITLDPDEVINYKLQYITIPLGLKLKSNQIGYTSFYVNVGFTNQYNISAKGSTGNSDKLNKDSIREEIGRFNIGYHFGGGIEYALGEDTSVTCGVIYHNGFIDVTTDSPVTYSRVLSVRFGIIF